MNTSFTFDTKNTEKQTHEECMRLHSKKEIRIHLYCTTSICLLRARHILVSGCIKFTAAGASAELK